MAEKAQVEENMSLFDVLSEFGRKCEEPFGQVIYHILPAEDWEKAQAVGIYSPDSIKSEGFIHCSRADQVERSLKVHFSGQEGLLLLCIAVSKVGAEIRDEDLYDAGQEFPHIYGPLNLDAVVGVLSLT